MDSQEPPKQPNPSNPSPSTRDVTVYRIQDLITRQNLDSRQIRYYIGEGVAYNVSDIIDFTITQNNRTYRRNDILVNPVPKGPPTPGSIDISGRSDEEPMKGGSKCHQ